MQQEFTRNLAPKTVHTIRNATEDALCLNPDCPSFSRFYRCANSNSEAADNSGHKQCKGWCWTVSQMNHIKEKCAFDGQNSENLDFLMDPIKSIFAINHLVKHGWRQQLGRVFQMLRDQINSYLNDVFDRCIIKFQQSVTTISKACSTIQDLGRFAECQKWNLKHQRIFRQKLTEELKRIQKIGILNVFNYEAVGNQIDLIKEQINRIEWAIWEKEPDFDREQRFKEFKYREQINEWKQKTVMQDIDISNKLHHISSILRLKGGVTFEEHTADLAAIKCGKCQKRIQSKRQCKNSRKSQCRSLLLKHMCLRHSQQILEKWVKKDNDSNCRLSHQQFLREISTFKIKRFLVIDRENVNTTNVAVIQQREIYSLEIVSKGRQNLASGRYMVAQSSGKDSADILIILVLYEITRVAGKSEIVLLTNDHYGKTLQPIFKERGSDIHLANRYTYQMISENENNKGQMIKQVQMIDQE